MRGHPPIPTDGRLNLLIRRAAEHAHNATLIAKLTPTTEQQFQRPKTVKYAPDPMDLRGIPAIGKGVAGASPGTNPTSILNHV